MQAGGDRIILLVLDGLGGLPDLPGGRTELESAVRPDLDKLARAGQLGGDQAAP